MIEIVTHVELIPIIVIDLYINTDLLIRFGFSKSYVSRNHKGRDAAYSRNFPFIMNKLKPVLSNLLNSICCYMVYSN